MARKGKTIEQQCKYYDCEDFISEVMLYHYECGNKKDMLDDYRELCKDAKQIVVQQLFELYAGNTYKLEKIISTLMFG